MSSRGGYERLPMYASVARQRSSSHHPGVTFTPPPSPRPSLRSRHDNHPKPHFFCRPRSIFLFLKFAVPAAILLILFGLFVYEPHIELAFYERNWIKQEIEQLAPLAGCFDPDKVSPKYNLSDGVYGKRTTSVQAGMPLRMGMDCYDFAGTIKKDTAQETPRRIPPEDRVQYHTYWRVDLAPFGPRQEWMLKSYFATQDISTTRLTLWSNGDLSSNEILQKYLRRYPDSFKLDVVNIPTLAQGTELQDSPLLGRKDAKAWVDGDLIRLLLLWNFGGVWIDMDSLLTRDLEPLLEHEFVTQWDCYGASRNSGLHSYVTIPSDKKYQPFNGALMRFRQHSPYLCEAFHIMNISTPPRSGSTDWGSLLYHKLWRRLVASSIPPFQVLPFCFSDGRSCRLDNRLPDPFTQDNSKGQWTMGLGVEQGGGLDRVLGKVFGVHLHNQWEKEFPKGGWVERLLLRKYDDKLAGRDTPGDEL